MDAIHLKTLTTLAIERLLANLRLSAPLMAKRAEAWMCGLSKTGHAADYFQHPLAFPMLLLPGWVEAAIQGEANLDFQADLVYSSVSGYYFIRMIDNVMDENRALERGLLPMTGFFHAHATQIYHHYFDPHHPFWAHFFHWNTLSAALAIEDHSSREIDFTTFQHVAGQKVVAGKIPIAAVLAHHHQLERLPAWEHFYDQLSCWHQMFNDILSWHKDSQHHTASYFLCEGQRRKHAHESIFAWLMREGFAWGLDTLNQWLAELLVLADDLGSPQLTAYLTKRGEMLNTQLRELTPSLAAMSQLLTDVTHVSLLEAQSR